MKKNFILLICLLMSVLVFSSCGKKYECEGCGVKTSKMYYDMDGDISYCEDCAREYWAPFDYENFRVK